MDEARFDRMTRILAHGHSRRSALRLLAAGAIAALGAGLGVEAAPAQTTCKPPGGKCSRHGQCCSGACNRRGRCRGCPSGEHLCGETCIPDDQCCAGNAAGKLCGQTCISTLECCTNGVPGCPAYQKCSAYRGGVCVSGNYGCRPQNCP
jgi:hypothetical protein